MPATDDIQKFFEDMFPDIPTIVRKVCVKLGRDPDRMDVDEFALSGSWFCYGRTITGCYVRSLAKGASRAETAEEMGIKRESVTVEKVDLIKMLQRIIRDEYTI